MQPNLSPIERAFQLAATGRYSTVSEIKLQLTREGYRQERRGAAARQADRGDYRKGAPHLLTVPFECGTPIADRDVISSTGFGDFAQKIGGGTTCA